MESWRQNDTPATATESLPFEIEVPPWESSSVERTSLELDPGQHTITVQAAVVSGATSFRLDDWTLVLTLWRVS